MKIENILLDMDGVLAAFHKLNEAYPYKTLTLEEYQKDPIFDMEKKWGITSEEFWQVIDKDTFWLDLKPFPWYKELYEKLAKIAPVTIASSPSKSSICIPQKQEWLKKYLGLDKDHCMFGSRKYLMANNSTLLVDDYPENIRKFRDAGGHAITLPSNWNTPNLNWDFIKSIHQF